MHLKFLKDLGNPYDYLAKDTSGKQSVNLVFMVFQKVF